MGLSDDIIKAWETAQELCDDLEKIAYPPQLDVDLHEAGWQTLNSLDPGSLFRTRDGVVAMKTEYHTFSRETQWNCYLLASGESAHFPEKDETLVQLIHMRLPDWEGGPDDD